MAKPHGFIEEMEANYGIGLRNLKLRRNQAPSLLNEGEPGGDAEPLGQSRKLYEELTKQTMDNNGELKRKNRGRNRRAEENLDKDYFTTI